MKKIAILGCENSHANQFLTLIKGKAAFRDVEVIGVYSDDTAAAEKLSRAFGVPVMSDPAEAVGRIDGLVITARHGDNHYKYARPYIDSGIPMFIDKPITIREDEAIEFMTQLKAKNVPISGGSSLKQDVIVKQFKEEALGEVDGKTVGGYIRAPYSSTNDYGGFYFYAQHLVEMVCEIFGRFPLSVLAKQNGQQIHVLFHYEQYDCVGLYCDNNYCYHITRMAEKGARSLDVPMTGEWYYNEFRDFHAILSGAAGTTTYEAFIAPVFIMNAIVRSLKSGNEEPVRKVEL